MCCKEPFRIGECELGWSLFEHFRNFAFAIFVVWVKTTRRTRGLLQGSIFNIRMRCDESKLTRWRLESISIYFLFPATEPLTAPYSHTIFSGILDVIIDKINIIKITIVINSSSSSSKASTLKYEKALKNTGDEYGITNIAEYSCIRYMERRSCSIDHGTS